MITKKKTMLAVAALAAAAALTACSGGAGTPADGGGDGGSNGAVAWSFASQDINIWAAQLPLMEKIVTDAGYEFLTDDPGWDVQTQVNDWQSWIARGDVKAIGGYPVDTASMASVTADATAAGIGVVSYAVSWDGVLATTEISNHDAGYSVAEAAGKWVKETYGDKKVSIAFMSDTSTGLGQEMLEGMREGMTASGANVTVHELETNTRDTGYSQAQSQLTADPETKVWLGIGVDMVLGARQALIDSGVDAGDKGYYVSATDVNEEVLGLIASGKDMWRTSFAYKATDLAQANASLLLAAAKGEKASNIVVGVTQVTADNVDDFKLD